MCCVCVAGVGEDMAAHAGEQTCSVNGFSMIHQSPPSVAALRCKTTQHCGNHVRCGLCGAMLCSVTASAATPARSGGGSVSSHWRRTRRGACTGACTSLHCCAPRDLSHAYTHNTPRSTAQAYQSLAQKVDVLLSFFIAHCVYGRPTSQVRHKVVTAVGGREHV